MGEAMKELACLEDATAQALLAAWRADVQSDAQLALSDYAEERGALTLAA